MAKAGSRRGARRWTVLGWGGQEAGSGRQDRDGLRLGLGVSRRSGGGGQGWGGGYMNLCAPAGGKAFGLLKAQQEERLNEINKVKEELRGRAWVWGGNVGRG